MLGLGVSPATLSARATGVPVPTGYSVVALAGARVFWSSGVLNLSSGRRVLGAGVSLFVEI